MTASNPCYALLCVGMLGTYVWSTRAAQEAAKGSPTVPVPRGLMHPIFPDGHPPSASEVTLGRDLFFAKNLSLDGAVSCANCHDPTAGFADPRPVSLGVYGRPGRRNSPTVLNAAFFDAMAWDGRHATLEAQALAALTDPQEMSLTEDTMVGKLTAAQSSQLEELYGEANPGTIAAALAAYQRSLIVGDSGFDRWMYGGEEDAVGLGTKRGFKIFLRQGRCIQCHVVRCKPCHPFGGESAFFTNNRFHNIGVGYDENGNTTDRGRAEFTGDPDDTGAFKTPTLRNVALTAPYMHDGSLPTLEDVVEHYNKGGNPNQYLDPEIRPLHLTDGDKRDLVDFLQSLTSLSGLREVSEGR